MLYKCQTKIKQSDTENYDWHDKAHDKLTLLFFTINTLMSTQKNKQSPISKVRLLLPYHLYDSRRSKTSNVTMQQKCLKLKILFI